MVEVPSLLWQLDEILMRADFLSVGSNDLFQFLFAVDRGNARVASRYDALSMPVLRALKMIADKARGAGVPVTLCGELASKPLEAMALIGLGFRHLSMSPAAIGPVKAALLECDAGEIEHVVARHLAGSGTPLLRETLREFAEKRGVPL
jgi:phosphotransferase system enzyme I (PtsP)